MSNLLLIILNNIDVLPDLLKVWREIGVPGTTILNSAGGHASNLWFKRVGLGAINKLFDAGEVQTRTLIAVFDDEKLLAQAIVEAERIVGDFNRPNSGMMVVVPVSQTYGVYKSPPPTPKEISPPALRSNWAVLRDTPVETVDSLLNLEPTIVSGSTPLDDVARAMLEHPDVHVASVVAEDGRLIGLLDLNSLADDLFLHVLPEEFLSEATNMKTMMAYADKTRTITAKDAMVPAAWVKHGDTVKEAFKLMHENKLPGLPFVDELYQVIGYINLLELLALCTQAKTDPDQQDVK